MTITVRYGAQRQQFGPAEGREVAVLDYSSQQLKLMPMLATCYALHFTAAFLVEQYTQAKRTKEEELVADVHSLSAGQFIKFSACSFNPAMSVLIQKRHPSAGQFIKFLACSFRPKMSICFRNVVSTLEIQTQKRMGTVKRVSTLWRCFRSLTLVDASTNVLAWLLACEAGLMCG